MIAATFAPSALLFSSSISAVIVGLMLFMASRLYAGNRRPAYRSLIFSFGFILLHHILKLGLTAGWIPASPGLVFTGKLLQTLAFVVMNFAVFELYFRRRPRTRTWFYGLLAVGVLIAAFAWTADADGASSGAVRIRALDGYLLALPPLFALMFGPHIGQRRKYAAGLAAAFLSQLLAMAAAYSETRADDFAAAAEILQAVYAILLFLLLFDRVVELLMSAYRSSITDGLTNLYNRKYFVSQLERMLKTGRPVGVIFCDIDNFKRLNDTHGHHKADGVLKQAAAILAEETEGAGLAGRYGGEELVACVSGGIPAVLQTAEAVRARIEKETLVTVSVGICAAVPGESAAAETLMQRADAAMYHSKTTGKNRVTDFASLDEARDRPQRAARP